MLHHGSSQLKTFRWQTLCHVHTTRSYQLKGIMLKVERDMSPLKIGLCTESLLRDKQALVFHVYQRLVSVRVKLEALLLFYITSLWFDH